MPKKIFIKKGKKKIKSTATSDKKIISDSNNISNISNSNQNYGIILEDKSSFCVDEQQKIHKRENLENLSSCMENLDISNKKLNQNLETLYDSSEIKKETLHNTSEIKKETLYDSSEIKKETLHNTFEIKKETLYDSSEIKKETLANTFEIKKETVKISNTDDNKKVENSKIEQIPNIDDKNIKTDDDELKDAIVYLRLENVENFLDEAAKNGIINENEVNYHMENIIDKFIPKANVNYKKFFFDINDVQTYIKNL